jgi:hypothetical protein
VAAVVARFLDRLNPSNSTGLPFIKLWQKNCESVEAAIAGLQDTIDAVIAAQAAADAANAAAAAAGAAATAADAAATSAQTTADNITDANEIGTSFVSGCTITATDAGTDVTITISAHTRKYPQPDGSTVDVAVNGGSLTGRAYTTLYYVYYDDPTRAGGAVTYASTTSDTTAAQLGDRHLVGSVLTPAAAGGPTGGGTVRGPGVGSVLV